MECPLTAARRQAGGVAATKLARAVMVTKTKLDGYMVSGYYFGSSNADRESLLVFSWNDRGFAKVVLNERVG